MTTRGGKRAGAGRPKGSTCAKKWKMLDDLAIKYNHSPLDYMLAVLNNPMSSPEKAAPYVHAKLATTTTKLGSDGPIKINIKWGDE
jgi:hypothetical protein